MRLILYDMTGNRLQGTVKVRYTIRIQDMAGHVFWDTVVADAVDGIVDMPFTLEDIENDIRTRYNEEPEPPYTVIELEVDRIIGSYYSDNLVTDYTAPQILTGMEDIEVQLNVIRRFTFKCSLQGVDPSQVNVFKAVMRYAPNVNLMGILFDLERATYGEGSIDYLPAGLEVEVDVWVRLYGWDSSEVYRFSYVVTEYVQTREETIDLTTPPPSVSVTLSAENTDIKTGDRTTIRAVVSPAGSYQLNFYLNGQPWFSDWTSDGVYEFDFISDEAGTFEIYCVEADSGEESNHVTITVTEKPPPPSVNAYLTSDRTTVGIGGEVKFTVRVEPPGYYYIVVYDNGVLRFGAPTDEHGNYEFSIKWNRPGTHVIVVKLPDYDVASNEVTITVTEEKELTIEVTPEKDQAIVGEEVSFSIHVTPESMYSLFVYVNGEYVERIVTDWSGRAMYIHKVLREGLNTFTFKAAEYPVETTVNVEGIMLKLSLEIDKKEIELGETVTLTLTVTPERRYDVDLYINDQYMQTMPTDNSGVLSMKWTPAEAGYYTVYFKERLSGAESNKVSLTVREKEEKPPEDKGELIVIVMDRNGGFIEGAEVFINGESYGTTDEMGRLSVFLPEDQYSVYAVYQGIESMHELAMVYEGGTESVTLIWPKPEYDKRYNVRFKVLDPDGEPMKDVEVRAYSWLFNLQVASGKTNDEGYVGFTLLPGKYTFVAWKEGYTAKPKIVTLTAGYTDTFKMVKTPVEVTIKVKCATILSEIVKDQIVSQLNTVEGIRDIQAKIDGDTITITYVDEKPPLWITLVLILAILIALNVLVYQVNISPLEEGVKLGTIAALAFITLMLTREKEERGGG